MEKQSEHTQAERLAAGHLTADRLAAKRSQVLREETSARGHCIRCLLQDYDEEAYVSKLLRVIRMMRPSEKAKEEVAAERLAVCRECDRLEMGTCLACGCYVELRAARKDGRCPYKKWK
jgi:hypothetical protein